MHVPDQYKNQEMCDKPVTEDPCLLKYVPDNFKKQKMCNKAVKKNPHRLSKKRKAQKEKRKEEILPSFWHPSR